MARARQNRPRPVVAEELRITPRHPHDTADCRHQEDLSDAVSRVATEFMSERRQPTRIAAYLAGI
jgi:hypothetical protein